MLMKNLLLLILCALLSSYSSLGQTCNPDSLKTIITKAIHTDPNISWELKNHYSFYNPTCVSNNTLLIYLGGSYGKPSNYLLFSELAGNNGFHVINLQYPNTVASKTACGSSTDTNCFSKFRKEILEGINYSTQVSVDSSNCIYNRIKKLLQYLHANYPSQGWNSYYSGNVIQWNKVMVAGHSQGGGHAALIGVNNPLKRVIMFASPNDYNNTLNQTAPWTSSAKSTPDSLYYGFINYFDDVVNSTEQFQIWNNLKMPVYGDSTNVDQVGFPYANSRQLYTKRTDTGTAVNHNLVVLDKDTPLVGGKPLFTSVWKYLLGINPLLSTPEINPKIEFTLYPNPSQNKLFNNCQCKIEKVMIRSVSGATILESENLKNSIDISELKAGIYFLTITSEHKMSTQRFTKID